jgi:hypothetical protein
MAEDTRESMKPELDIALARGITVARWARENDVSQSTVYRWSHEPEVRKMVEACRRRLIDQAIGRPSALAGGSCPRDQQPAGVHRHESGCARTRFAMLANAARSVR